MYQEKYGNVIVVKPSEGYSLVFRGDSSGSTYDRITRHKDSSFEDIVEVKKDYSEVYIPQYEEDEKNLEDVGKIRQLVVSKSKVILEEFLKENPLEFEGAYYNVSSEAQNHLASVIKAAEYAQSLGISYTPKWNPIDGKRVSYSLETLKRLFIEIQDYVLSFVIQQQEIEEQILALNDKIEILNFNIVYKKGE